MNGEIGDKVSEDTNEEIILNLVNKETASEKWQSFYCHVYLSHFFEY